MTKCKQKLTLIVHFIISQMPFLFCKRPSASRPWDQFTGGFVPGPNLGTSFSQTPCVWSPKNP